VSAHDLRVAQLMTRTVRTLEPSLSLPLAESLMEIHHIRHLPVVDATGALVGLVTHRDLLRASISALAPLTANERTSLQLAVPVGRIMQTNVWTISSDALALNAARIMRDHRIGCLPVVDEGRLVGILTEADLLVLLDATLSPREPRAPVTVEHAMTPSPVTIGNETTLADARSVMAAWGVRHLPVVSGSRAVSMVSDRDLRVAELVFRQVDSAKASRAVSLVANDSVRRVQADSALEVVLLEMYADRVDAVLVCKGERLVGILCASDACRLLGEDLRRRTS
jgi:CBS domain-containing membrane protein